MDRITQGNAASAEESAGAADELNTQARALKTAVTELLRLVEGRDMEQSSRSSRVQKTPASTQTQPQPEPARPGRQPNVHLAEADMTSRAAETAEVAFR